LVKPYTNIYNEDGSFVRVFDKDVDPEELVWHRDERDRTIRVIKGNDWMFQFDDEMPISINRVTTIPKMVYHRLIKGEGDLVIEVREQ